MCFLLLTLVIRRINGQLMNTLSSPSTKRCVLRGVVGGGTPVHPLRIKFSFLINLQCHNFSIL